jgi:hypothetical protein
MVLNDTALGFRPLLGRVIFPVRPRPIRAHKQHFPRMTEETPGRLVYAFILTVLRNGRCSRKGK